MTKEKILEGANLLNDLNTENAILDVVDTLLENGTISSLDVMVYLGQDGKMKNIFIDEPETIERILLLLRNVSKTNVSIIENQINEL